MHRVRLKEPNHGVSFARRQGSCLAPHAKMAVREMTPSQENRCSQMIYCAQMRDAIFQQSETAMGISVPRTTCTYTNLYICLVRYCYCYCYYKSGLNLI
jgi:hypothetical protein